MAPLVRSLFRLMLGLPVLLAGANAYAQANYESALIGGRASLMGGTGVASGTDAAAPLQNPATIVGVKGTSFVFSTFFVQLNSRHLDVDSDVIREVRKGTTDLSQTQFRVLPTATCLFLDLAKRPDGEKGSHKLSICIAEPEQETYALHAQVLATTATGQTGFQNRFLGQEFSKKVYSLGWGMTLGSGLSIGISPTVEDVNHKDEEGVLQLLADGAPGGGLVGSTGDQVTNVKTRMASAFAASALFGVRYKVSPNFAAGLSVQTPSLHLGGSYQSTRSSDQLFGDSQQYLQEKGSARFTYPLRVAVGVGGNLGKVRYEVNGYFHAPQNDFVEISALRQSITLGGEVVTAAAADQVVYREAARPVANFGLGVEVPVSQKWAVLFGFLTDLSGLNPRVTGTPTDEVLFRNRSDLLHGSVGVAWTPPAGTLLLGTRFFYGEGELATTNTRELPPLLIAQRETRWGLSLVLSGQLSLEMLQLADPTGLVKKATTKGQPSSNKNAVTTEPK